MKIKLIAGKYGGRIIDGSGTNRTHPMSERIRSALFNIIGSEIHDAVVLDAFAGSGSLGLEALSRGAKSVVFVEKDRIAQKIIQANMQAIGVQENQAVLMRSPLASWVKHNRDNADQKFSLIFADPPFHDPQFSTVISLLELLQPNGLMVLSYADTMELPSELGIVVVDNRSYGNAALAFCRKKDA